MEKILKDLIPKAKNYINNKKRLKRLITRASDKALNLKDKDKRDSFKDNISYSISLLKDWFNGEYTEIPKKSILAVISALIYFIMPFDLIPDFIVGTGLFDDAAVLSYMFALIQGDINKYKTFKKNKEQYDLYRSKVKSAFSCSYFFDDKSKNILKNNNEDISAIPLFLYSFFINNDYNKDNYKKYLIKFSKNGYFEHINLDKEFKMAFLQQKKISIEKNESYLFYIMPVYLLYLIRTINVDEEEHLHLFINEFISFVYKNDGNKDISELFIFLYFLLKKIIFQQSELKDLLLKHNYELLNFSNPELFHISKGEYLSKNIHDIGKHDSYLYNIIEVSFWLLYNAKTYEELDSYLFKIEHDKTLYFFSSFLWGLYNNIDIDFDFKYKDKLNLIINEGV